MSARAQRVADQIQREIAALIQLEVNDPRIGMVSVTTVEVSRDLSYAKIYVTVLNSLSDSGAVNSSTLSTPGQLDKLEIDENLKALNGATGYLRSLLAKRLTLRSVPKLRFYYDGSVERGRHLSVLIDHAFAGDRDLHS